MKNNIVLKRLLGPTVSSILIKGRPGTGKTALSLELLRLGGGGIYISTRVAETKFVSQFPAVRKLIKTGKFKVKAIEVKDFRLSSAGMLVDEILSYLIEMPERIIVLDSWDAVSKELDEIERLKVEKSLVAMVESKPKAKLVFVSEEVGTIVTDYLVDALVHLHREEVEGRLYRTMEWVKVRGTEIPPYKVPFTLMNGRFKVLPEFPVITEYSRVKEIPPVKEKAVLPFGELSNILAKRAGKIIMFDVGEAIPGLWVWAAALNFMYETVMHGYSLIEIPGVAPPERYLSKILNIFDKKILLDRLRFGIVGETGLEEMKWVEEAGMEDLVFSLPKKVEEALEVLLNKVEEIGKERPVIIKIGLTMMETIYGKKDLSYLIGLLNREIRKRGDRIVYMAHPFLKVRSLVKFLADEVIRFENRDGVLIAWNEKYPSPIYACYLKGMGGRTVFKVMEVR